MFEKWNKSDFRKISKNLSVKEILKTNSSNRRKIILGKKKTNAKSKSCKEGKYWETWTMTMNNEIKIIILLSC